MRADLHTRIKIATILLLVVSISHPISYAQKVTTALMEYQRSFSTFKTDTSLIFDKIDKASERVNRGALDSAEMMFNQALGISLRTNFNDGLGQSFIGLGVCKMKQGKFDEALKYYNIAIPYCQKATFRTYLTGGVYNDIGLVYAFQSFYPLAIRQFYFALQDMTDRHVYRPDMIANTYSNLGLIWMKQKQYETALFYLKRAEQIALKYGLKAILIKIYIDMGGCYTDDKRVDIGRKYLLKGLELGHELNDSLSQYCGLYNLAVGYEAKDPQKALQYYNDALNYVSANPYYSKTDLFIGKANAYYNMSNLDAAQNYILIALDSARKYKMMGSLLYASRGAAMIYEKKGDYKKAYKYLSIHSDISDSLTDIKQDLANHEYEVKYHTAEKDKELVTRKLLITQQQSMLARKNLWILGISAGAIFITLILISTTSSYRRRQLIQQKELKIIKQTREIDELKAAARGEEKERTRLGRELHDGVGGLFSAFIMSFNSLGKENKYLNDSKTYRKTAEILCEITKEIRKTSHNLMPDALLHYSLPEAVRQFCNYMQDNKGNMLQIVCQNYGHFELMDNDTMLSTYRIIQELIQNVVKHSQATYALVQLIIRENTLNITVEDNGIGFDGNKNGNGMGLSNLRSRIKSMNGTFTLESFSGKGTTVFIEFELISSEVISQ